MQESSLITRDICYFWRPSFRLVWHFFFNINCDVLSYGPNKRQGCNILSHCRPIGKKVCFLCICYDLKILTRLIKFKHFTQTLFAWVSWDFFHELWITSIFPGWIHRRSSCGNGTHYHIITECWEISCHSSKFAFF